MRAIDADAMIDRLKEWNTKDKTDKALYNFTLARINEQPTIQPEPSQVATDSDTISRQAAIEEVSRNIPVKSWKDVARVVELMKIFANRIKQLPPAQPAIVPCNYVEACNVATMDKLTSAVLYLDVLEELKKHGYVLVDMRGVTS